MKKFLTMAAVAALTVSGGQATAQTSSGQSAQDRIGSILGTIFGGRLGNVGTVGTTLDAQWAAGRTPLSDQRFEFDSRVNAEVRAGRLTQAVATRVQSDYDALVQAEARYGSDGQFSTQERADLSNRYAALTQVLADRGYADGNTGYGTQVGSSAEVAGGRAEFETRVNAAVTARRITRVEGTRLKADYAALIRTETDYLRDGSISQSEREDLDARLDAFDTRLDGAATAAVVVTPRARLDAITRALPTSGLSVAAKAQLRVEQQDLARLEAAYARLTVSADERAYLARRIGELEVRARVRRY